MARNAGPELVLDARSVLGEGAIWDAKKGVLYWVDIDAGLVHVFDPASGRDVSISVGQPVGTVVPRARGGLMLAVRDGFMSLDQGTGETALEAAPPGHEPAHRFNDGKCDPAGRFWAGTMESPAGKGALFRLDTDLSVHRMADGIAIANGLAWGPDGKTMYYIDTATRRIDVFDYDNASGAIGNRRPVATVPEEHGLPDGMTIDDEGMLWVAHWDGWCVCRWDPRSGKLVRKVEMPVQRPTSCAFGGPDFDVLYVTSATVELEAAALAEQPQAGGIFAFRPGVGGLPALEFKG